MNASKTAFSDAIVTDQLQTDGMEYVPTSVKVYKGVWADEMMRKTALKNRQLVTDKEGDFCADNKSFTVKLGEVAQSEGYLIESIKCSLCASFSGNIRERCKLRCKQNTYWMQKNHHMYIKQLVVQRWLHLKIIITKK